jgi:hypothetical protein
MSVYSADENEKVAQYYICAGFWNLGVLLLHLQGYLDSWLLLFHVCDDVGRKSYT